MFKFKNYTILLTMLVLMSFSSICFATPGIDWDANVIEAEGNGIAPANVISQGQGKALARRAAIVDSYRNLASIIYGVQLENNTTIEQLAVKKDTIQTNISGLIKGARIVDEGYDADGIYTVKMAVKIFDSQDSLSSAVWKDKSPAVPTLAPTIKSDTIYSEPTKTSVPAGSITGVIIDCRGLGLDRAMSPVIEDNSGRKIYGTDHVDSQWVIKNGMASYVHDDNPSGLLRAGNNPLVIKAVSLNNHDWNPVVTKEDADKILSANQVSGFLRQCPVVFIQ